MDLLLQKIPKPGKVILHTFLGIIAMAVLFLIVISLYQYTVKTLQAHNISMTIALPYFPFVLVTAISMTLFFITMLVNFLHAYDEWRAK
jgi:TRAP-type C4-dicarboxylate transport system permease small subunit